MRVSILLALFSWHMLYAQTMSPELPISTSVPEPMTTGLPADLPDTTRAASPMSTGLPTNLPDTTSPAPPQPEPTEPMPTGLPVPETTAPVHPPDPEPRSTEPAEQPSGGNATLTAERLAAFTAAYAKWTTLGLTNYVFDYTTSCFCPLCYRDAVQVQVFNGKVTSGYVSSTTAASCKSNPAALKFRNQTMAQMFETLRRTILQNPYSLTVSYHATYGYPLSISIDMSAGVADDEKTISVTCLQPWQGPQRRGRHGRRGRHHRHLLQTSSGYTQCSKILHLNGHGCHGHHHGWHHRHHGAGCIIFIVVVLALCTCCCIAGRKIYKRRRRNRPSAPPATEMQNVAYSELGVSGV